MTVTVWLPYPPSANRLWRNSGARVHKSREYTAWLLEAGAELRKQRPGKLPGRYKISIKAVAPDKRRRDLDNLAKPIGDLLQSCGVIDDDCNARKITLEWATGGDGVVVELEPAA